MPPKGERLTPAQIETIRAWIDAGAPWPNDSVEPAAANPPNHWAFFAPLHPAVPGTEGSAWVRNPVDAFVSVAHRALGLEPSAEASRPVLIRRVMLDLTGLPPTPEQVREFESDPSADAYERMVERALASPHYGERWGRHWLDLARWGESDSFEANEFRPSAWRYRDYVVASFNQDKPHDYFLRQQLAGDELTPYSDENVIATGFLAGARLNNNEEDKAVQRNEALVDIVNATSSALLGLSLNCAQCHDHKFDPLTSEDYYRFQAFFVKGQMNSVVLKDPEQWSRYERTIPPEYEPARQLQKLLLDPARARLAEAARKKLSRESLEALEIPEAKRTPAQAGLARKAAQDLEISREAVEKSLGADDQKLSQELGKKISALERKLNEAKPQAWAFYSPATSPHALDALPPKGMYPLPYDPKKLATNEARVLKRGDVHRPGDLAEMAWPNVLGCVCETTQPVSRQDLVDWMTTAANPLVARVWVNYVWQQHFGRGLVSTPGDFGLRGAVPTHPALLDWLATEFIGSNVSETNLLFGTKRLHRLIVLSQTYRQSAQFSAGNARVDPENKYLWRWNPRRLESEAIRDSLLMASGELDSRLGGESVPPKEEGSSRRRALYLRQRRHDFPAMQALFDAPSASESCPRRHVSTVALQPLFMLNNEFVLQRAEAFAATVRQKAGPDQAAQIRESFCIALARAPRLEETAAADRFFSRLEQLETPSGVSKDSGLVSLLPLTRFCHSLMNLNEFVYIQ